MAFEQKPGSFALFKNDKGDNDKRPDYRGDGLDLAGRPIEVAAWLREGRKGKFMSCTIKLKAGGTQPTTRTAPGRDVDPDEEPF